MTQVKVVVQNKQRSQFSIPLVLGAIWLVGALCDRIWLALDRSIPAWDQTNHLTGSLNYLNALQHAQWFSAAWWKSFWMLSNKYPPLTYIATAPFQQVFGTGPDRALLVNLLFSAILLGSVYGLGKHLFNSRVGLWAAGVCVLLPRLYTFRLNYLIDYPLTALVAASFFCLTLWRDAKTRRQGWIRALQFGVCLGLAMMVKQSVLFFLFVPLLWLSIPLLWKRLWGRLLQLISGLFLCVLIFGPWYRTNWIYLLSTPQNAVVGPAASEGDPALNTLTAWTYYWNDLPRAVSWPLLLVPLVGLLLYWMFPRFRKQANSDRNSQYTSGSSLQSQPSDNNLKSTPPTLSRGENPKSIASAFRWLAVFLVASYLICSANPNKDLRYIMPYLPILAVVLAYGLAVWPKRLRAVPWGAVGLAFLLMCLNLFPIGGTPGTFLTQALSSNAQTYPYLGQTWPQRQVIDEIARTEPQLQATVGVMTRIPQLNHNNINYYGALKNFQVYGREVGVRKRYVDRDARSLSWYITKTGDLGTQKETPIRMVQTLDRSPDLQVHKTWNLPDGSVLKLFHRTPAPIQVEPINLNQTQVKLERVTVPQQAPPNAPVPVTYEWSGPWEQLRSGIVLVTWKEVRSQGLGVRSQESGVRSQGLGVRSQESGVRSQESGVRSQESGVRSQLSVSDSRIVTLNQNPKSEIQNPKSNRWLHDHGIGMGKLYSERLSKQQSQGSFRVIERTAMLPPADIGAGAYTLEATYLNRETGENYAIAVPSVRLNITPNAPAIPAPELDLVTQMRTLAHRLPEGRKALDPVFDEIGRINQYDPVQDYTVQADRALDYRLQQEPQNVDWAYALAFSKILQEDAEGAIRALKRVVQLDSRNPYAHAYLAFVYLYQWQGKNAQEAIQPALALNPNIPEIRAISGVAALLQGNIFKAWHMLQGLKDRI
jgi:4-amino-4-deoxy-L-arabinose transferase-like glycosyltransferase